jgi:hypothetical protein
VIIAAIAATITKIVGHLEIMPILPSGKRRRQTQCLRQRREIMADHEVTMIRAAQAVQPLEQVDTLESVITTGLSAE